MTGPLRMQLRIMLPTDVVVDEVVDKVIAEAPNGAFCLLPRHIDFVSALVPGIVCYSQDGRTSYVAVNEGLLVKCGQDVLVSTISAIVGHDLASLRSTISATLQQWDEHDELTRSALARLEAGTLRRFAELEQLSHG